jgi:hypothetical protein
MNLKDITEQTFDNFLKRGRVTAEQFGKLNPEEQRVILENTPANQLTRHLVIKLDKSLQEEYFTKWHSDSSAIVHLLEIARQWGQPSSALAKMALEVCHFAENPIEEFFYWIKYSDDKEKKNDIKKQLIDIPQWVFDDAKLFYVAQISLWLHSFSGNERKKWEGICFGAADFKINILPRGQEESNFGKPLPLLQTEKNPSQNFFNFGWFAKKNKTTTDKITDKIEKQIKVDDSSLPQNKNGRFKSTLVLVLVLALFGFGLSSLWTTVSPLFPNPATETFVTSIVSPTSTALLPASPTETELPSPTPIPTESVALIPGQDWGNDWLAFDREKEFAPGFFQIMRLEIPDKTQVVFDFPNSGITPSCGSRNLADTLLNIRQPSLVKDSNGKNKISFWVTCSNNTYGIARVYLGANLAVVTQKDSGNAILSGNNATLETAQRLSWSPNGNHFSAITGLKDKPQYLVYDDSFFAFGDSIATGLRNQLISVPVEDLKNTSISRPNILAYSWYGNEKILVALAPYASETDTFWIFDISQKSLSSILDQTLSLSSKQTIAYIDIFNNDVKSTAAILISENGAYSFVFCDMKTQQCESPVSLPLFEEIYQIMWSPDGQNIALSARLNQKAIIDTSFNDAENPTKIDESCSKGCLFVSSRAVNDFYWVKNITGGIQHFWWSAP